MGSAFGTRCVMQRGQRRYAERSTTHIWVLIAEEQEVETLFPKRGRLARQMRYKRRSQASLYFGRHGGEQPPGVFRYVPHWILLIRSEEVVVEDCTPSLSFAWRQVSKRQQAM